MRNKNNFLVVLLFCLIGNLNAQFIHPGLSHKKSDLDRMKYQVQSKIEPYYSSYQLFIADSRSGYDYQVGGDGTVTDVSSDFGDFTNDGRAAYNNAVLWYITEDTRYAEKCIEIFNAWTQITNASSFALEAGKVYHIIEGAEIIKHTYSGWKEEDRKKFEDMLVYPGYSNTKAPTSSNQTFYWRSYLGDPGRHGNQGISGMRAILAMGVFLDNEIMYDRALRCFKGLPHRADDLAYASGPGISGSLIEDQSTDYVDTYSNSRGTSEDYFFNETLIYYIYENGQSQESSRDQQHVYFGIGSLLSMAEIAWNQNEDLYAYEDDRILKGFEFTNKYNLSFDQSYPDQLTSWEPTVDSEEFLEGFDRTGRWFSKAISPTGRGEFAKRPVNELLVSHYLGRGIKTEDDVKWSLRTRDYVVENIGYETAGQTTDHLGFGGLTARRVDYCYGDAITGYSSNIPDFGIPVLPTTIEAENFDYFPVNGNGITYYDSDAGNSEEQYRTDVDVDILECTDGFCVSDIESGEWMTYTVYVPETGTYDLSIRYATEVDGGSLTFSFGGKEKTGKIAIPSTASAQIFSDYTLASGVLLAQGVQSMKVFANQSGLILDNISISESNDCVASPIFDASEFSFETGIRYNYYEGSWNNIPDFENQKVISDGIASSIGLNYGEIDDGYAYVFTGYIDIENQEDYTFYTESDDGSSLWINGVQIVNNDGSHGVEEQSGMICLQPGYHEIMVEYFDKSGGQSLSASYEGTSFSKKDIPVYYAASNNQTYLSHSYLEKKLDFSLINNVVTFTSLHSGSMVYVYDYKGKIVKRLDLTKQLKDKIDLNNLSNGIYFLRVVDENNYQIQAIAKH